MVYRELTISQIEKWLGIKKGEIPEHLILYASWPWPLRKRLEEVRLYLKKPELVGEKELGNFWVGKMGNREVGFILVYGHGMAADMLYILIKLGVKYIFQTGSIGALQKNIKLFDLIIPTSAIKFEGLSHHFFNQKTVKCDSQLLNVMKKILEKRNFTNFHTGKTISIDFLFAETKERVKKWSQEGFLGIDMETATTYAMCKLLKAKSIAILKVIDNLVRKGELVSDLKNKAFEKRNEEMKIFIKHILKETISEVEKNSI